MFEQVIICILLKKKENRLAVRMAVLSVPNSFILLKMKRIGVQTSHQPNVGLL